MRLTAVLIAFLLIGCASTKKIKETKETNKTTEIHKDSVTSILKTLPSKNVIVLDANDFKLRGDFKQEVSAGKGNTTTIQKKGNKLIVSNNNAGSSELKTNTKEVVYNYEYIKEEYEKIIKRLSLKHKLLILLILIVWQRKLIAQILSAFFPKMLNFRFIQIILGKY